MFAVMKTSTPILFCLASAIGFSVLGADREEIEFFERKIRPILVENCYECHSEAEQERKGGLLLDRESAWLAGGDSGKAIVPGNLEASLLVSVIRREDEDIAMPPRKHLSESEVRLLERWILKGAPGPEDDIGETRFSLLGDQTALFDSAQTHWAFQAVVAKDPLQVEDLKWNANPIDRFVYSRLAQEGIEPSNPANERTLTRRLSVDLVGLPPKDGWFGISTESLVEELVDSPQFGEHFARLWLDVARYGDTANTYRPDTKTPHYYPYAFTYRDYVIDALNSDKPYDQFIREQLAADLMGLEGDAPELAALGFIGVSPVRNMSADFVDDVIDVTTRGFLGMTVACSRCHDHKFEPVPTTDYYSLYGVFRSVNRPEPWKIDQFPVIRGYDVSPEIKVDYEKKRAAIDKKISDAGNKTKGGNRRSVAETIRHTELAELLLTHRGAPAKAMAISDAKRAIDPYVFVRGDATIKGESVPRRFLKVLDPGQTAFSNKTSGRLELANKIASPENPLTARVFVNRIWGALMGNYLVETPSDFGLQGAEPTHPELLDWLAADFVEHQWSIKHLVKQIVSSRTFQQDSRSREDPAEKDPQNRLLWRANVKRLSFEEVRDSMLAVSGVLDSRAGDRGAPLLGKDYTKRRSIYGYINRFNLDPTLRAFDYPSPSQSQAKRTESVVASQSLFLMNSPFVVDQANALVDRLNFADEKPRERRIQDLFGAVLFRSAEEGEVERIEKFLAIEERRNVDPWPVLAQSLLMSNEFLYFD